VFKFGEYIKIKDLRNVVHVSNLDWISGIGRCAGYTQLGNVDFVIVEFKDYLRGVLSTEQNIELVSKEIGDQEWRDFNKDPNQSWSE